MAQLSHKSADQNNTGTQSGGNDFPGVAGPFGVVKLGPDLFDGVSVTNLAIPLPVNSLGSA
jgi:putative alpha-1,2-mannosidase